MREWHLRGAICSLALAAVITFFPASAWAQSIAYSYDALDRLVTATYPSGTTITYAYDAAGNRTQVTNAPPPPPPPPPPPLVSTTNVASWTRTPSSTPAAVVCTASGGTAPYSYRWVYVSGDNLTEATNEFDSSTTWFRPATSTAKVSTWRCRVTDSTTATANSSNVTVSIRTN